MRQHLLEALGLGRGHQRGLAQLALPLRRLLGEDVLLVRLAAHELARAGSLEALRGAAVGFHLRHQETPCSLPASAPAVSTGSATTSSCAALRSAFFSRSIASRLGARIIERKRPSMRGGFSTAAIGPSSSTTWSICLRPISRWTSSRPRYITVTLTLSPSNKKRRAFLTLKSRSC